MARSGSHVERVFLDVMVVLMVAGRAAAPEAVLTQVVVVAALTLVAEAGEGLAATCLTRHRMID